MFLGWFVIPAAYIERSCILTAPLDAAGGRVARQTAPTAHPEGAQKGGQNSSIALDQTGYGAILRVHWGPLDRAFPRPRTPLDPPGA